MSSGERIVVQDLGPGWEWVVEMEWPEGVTSGGPAALVIRPSDPDSYPAGGISSTLLREIDFREAAERLRRQVTAAERWDKARGRYEQDRSERLREAVSHGITDEYLALLSSAYVSAVNHGQPRPLEHLAEQAGKSLAAIKNHLWQATRRSLLERSAGRPGGRLTEKASGILERIVPNAPIR